MLKKVLLPFLCLCSCAFANLPNQVVGFRTFAHDNYGDFVGDMVVVLSDGTEWKSHPTQQEMVATWEVGDFVEIDVRDSFYWFKREHKFCLRNKTQARDLKAMLVSYGHYPLEIVYASTPYATSFRFKPVYDNEGKEIRREFEPTDYCQDLRLNDGSEFRMKSREFQSGQRVYRSFHNQKGKYFLISGLEREAKWTVVDSILRSPGF